MTGTNDLSATQLLLVAASKLPEVFHESDLVVAAWKESPESFGLRGYESSHPDSNRTLAPLCGNRGLVAQGWLVKHPDRYYGLSKAGSEQVREMANGCRKPLHKRKIPTVAAALLDTLFQSQAFTRWRSGMLAGMPAMHADLYLELFDDGSVIQVVLDNMTGDYAELPSGQEITTADLDKLQQCAIALRLTVEKRARRNGKVTV